MAKTGKAKKPDDSNELLEALTVLEKEKNISKEVLLEAIESSLITACKNHFGKADNIKVEIDPETCKFHIFAEKTVVEKVEDPVTEISLAEAKMHDDRLDLGDIYRQEVESKSFGRIATQNAKNVILQKIREEERRVVYDQFNGKNKDIVTGVVQRYIGNNVSINLGKADAILNEKEMVKGEHFVPTQRVKVYILDVKMTNRGPKILVSRTHPELVKRLFEEEVAEVRDGIVEIKAIAREAGSRTKIAVASNDPDVDPVGACVGLNGARVNAIVDMLNGEKIDIISWDENSAILIQNALSPAQVVSVIADSEEKTAKVVVPDFQLSLAIGKEGQNARLAARLTGFKIDIKSETQASEAGDFLDYETEYLDEDESNYQGGYEYGEGGYDEGYGDAYSYNEGGEQYGGDGYYEDDRYYEDGAYYGDGEYADDEYEDGEYADGQYEDGEYADDEYGDGEYADGQYEDGEYADDEYEDGEYADDEYEDGEYAYGQYEDGEYADGQYEEGEYEEDGYDGKEDADEE